MSDIALYYPNIWMRNETWLKAALLYWPKIARMVPGMSGRESWEHGSKPPGPWRGCWPPEAYSRLRKRDPEFLLDLRASSAGNEPADEFAGVIEEWVEPLREMYGIESLLGELPPSANLDLQNRSVQSLPLEWVHQDKMNWELIRAMTDAQLAVRYGEWTGMHPKLAWTYMCAVADRLAQKNQMPAVTDEQRVHTSLNGWTTDTLAASLLYDDESFSGPHDLEEVGRLFTVMAFQIILPAGLDDIPIDRILDAREKLMPGLYAYRRYLDGLAEQFSAIAAVEDPRARREHLSIMIRGELQPRLKEQESRMKGLGFHPVRAVLGMKALAPSALIATAANGLGLPEVVTATSTIAACLVGATLDARQQARAAAAESPVSYLLDLKHQLSPQDLVSRSRARLLGRP